MNYFMIAPFKLAAFYSTVREEFGRRGHRLTHDWLAATKGRKPGNFSKGHSELLRMSLKGIRQADLVIYLSPGGHDSFIEFGAALMTGKPIIVAGPANLFQEASHFNHNSVIRFRYPAFASHNTVANMLADSLEAIKDES